MHKKSAGRETAFVSFRLPMEARDRLRRAAAEDARSLQDFMTDMVSRALAARPPAGKRLPDIVRALRKRRRELAERHVKHLWVFGSVARGEDNGSSDVDLIADIGPDAKMSLTGFARLQLDLTEMLGQPVDLAEWRTLRPCAAEEARKDAVSVF